MVDKRVQTNGNVNVFWVPLSGIANIDAPTEAEMAAAIPLSAGISWESFTMGITGVSEQDDRSLLDPANKKERGSAQYGAEVTYFYPATLTDVSDDYLKSLNLFKAGRVEGYFILKVLQNTRYQSAVPVAGDWVTVLKVTADYIAHDTEGEDSIKYTINYLPLGAARAYALVKGTTGNTITVSPAPTITTVGAVAPLTATLYGKSITQGATWSSSDSSKVSVSPNGVVKRIAAGTATITCSHPAAAAPVTVSIAA